MRAVRAVVGSRFDYAFVSLGVVVDVFLTERWYVEKTVQQVGTPVEQAGVFTDIVASCTECGKWPTLKEGGRANDCLLSCVIATPVTGPSYIKKSVICKQYCLKPWSILTGHILAVTIGIVTTEEGVCFVAIHNRVESTDNLWRWSISEVLAVELAAASPPVCMVFGMLGELYRVIETLTELVCL